MYNIDLSAMPHIKADGDFFIQPLPAAWREILEERFPIVAELLDCSSTYLAGGLLRTMLMQTEMLSPNLTDIDLFFGSPDTYQSIKLFFENHKNGEFEKVFQCPQDLLASYVHTPTGWKYQAVANEFHESVVDVVQDFDFTTICIGTDGENIVFHQYAIEDTLNKNLRWNKITYPAASLRRLMKYARKGYTMSEAEYQYFVSMVASHSLDIRDEQLVYLD